LEGNDNIAVSDANYITGPGEGGGATAGLGNDNIAYVLDPFGTASTAGAGGDPNTLAPGDFNLAAVLLTDGNAVAQGGSDNLYDVITALGNESGTAAATSGGWLAELLSLF
jgi:hypothetical protein